MSSNKNNTFNFCNTVSRYNVSRASPSCLGFSLNNPTNKSTKDLGTCGRLDYSINKKLLAKKAYIFSKGKSNVTGGGLVYVDLEKDQRDTNYTPFLKEFGLGSTVGLPKWKQFTNIPGKLVPGI